ncbi:uncharacterized protein LOC131213560 [Anopheles bellator]|uniref:uncharacterized protein LOC131213560 n=1 Tax=Anopheles bellator TaxID=139047 RepID=UPI002649F1DC|nr:uncharacterized protein LOC131213560 [Anopheles bellator]
MNKLLVGSVVVVGLLVATLLQPASGSLYGPFGPFAGAQFGPPGLGAFGPGYGGAAAGLPLYPSVVGRPGAPVYQPFLPVASPLLGRSLAPAAAAPLPAAATGNLRTVVSGSDVLERLAVADLPEDLQQRAQELQLASEQGFDACEELLATPGAYWQYKRCQAFQLRNALTAAKALEQEATARAAAAAAAAAAATSTEAAVAVPAEASV